MEVLTKINDYLDLHIPTKLVEKIYTNSSADKMRNKELLNQLDGFKDFGKERDQLKVRNAKIGGYKKELSVEDINYCNQELKNLNPYFNYKV